MHRVGQLGHDHRHRVVLGSAVDQVLVDLVGDHPQAVLRRPTGRWPRSPRAGRPPRWGSTATRTGAPSSVRCVAASNWSTVTRNPLVASVGMTTGTPPARTIDLGVGGPVRGQHEDLVARVAQDGERVGDGLLPAVGHQDLRRGDLEAGVTPGLDGHGLTQLGKAGRGGVLVVRGSRQASTAAATMASGVGKSGSPAPKPMTLSPWALSALALASTARVAEGDTAAARAEIRRSVMVAGGRPRRARFLGAQPWCHDSIRDRHP